LGFAFFGGSLPYPGSFFVGVTLCPSKPVEGAKILRGLGEEADGLAVGPGGVCCRIWENRSWGISTKKRLRVGFPLTGAEGGAGWEGGALGGGANPKNHTKEAEFKTIIFFNSEGEGLPGAAGVPATRAPPFLQCVRAADGQIGVVGRGSAAGVWTGV
jgi:hypothetical protein